jgi:hypothetical protein
METNEHGIDTGLGIFGAPAKASEGQQQTKELTRCTVEVTPTEALSEADLTVLYESFALLGLDGVEQWIGFDTEYLAFGLHNLIATAAIDTSQCSGYAVLEAIEALPTVQSVRNRDGYSLSSSKARTGGEAGALSPEEVMANERVEASINALQPMADATRSKCERAD